MRMVTQKIRPRMGRPKKKRGSENSEEKGSLKSEPGRDGVSVDERKDASNVVDNDAADWGKYERDWPKGGWEESAGERSPYTFPKDDGEHGPKDDDFFFKWSWWHKQKGLMTELTPRGSRLQWKKGRSKIKKRKAVERTGHVHSCGQDERASQQNRRYEGQAKSTSYRHVQRKRRRNDKKQRQRDSFDKIKLCGDTTLIPPDIEYSLEMERLLCKSLENERAEAEDSRVTVKKMEGETTVKEEKVQRNEKGKPSENLDPSSLPPERNMPTVGNPDKNVAVKVESERSMRRNDQISIKLGTAEPVRERVPEGSEKEDYLSLSIKVCGQNQDEITEVGACVARMTDDGRLSSVEAFHYIITRGQKSTPSHQDDENESTKFLFGESKRVEVAEARELVKCHCRTARHLIAHDNLSVMKQLSLMGAALDCIVTDTQVLFNEKLSLRDTYKSLFGFTPGQLGNSGNVAFYSLQIFLILTNTDTTSYSNYPSFERAVEQAMDIKPKTEPHTVSDTFEQQACAQARAVNSSLEEKCKEGDTKESRKEKAGKKRKREVTFEGFAAKRELTSANEETESVETEDTEVSRHNEDAIETDGDRTNCKVEAAAKGGVKLEQALTVESGTGQEQCGLDELEDAEPQPPGGLHSRRGIKPESRAQPSGSSRELEGSAYAHDKKGALRNYSSEILREREKKKPKPPVSPNERVAEAENPGGDEKIPTIEQATIEQVADGASSHDGREENSEAEASPCREKQYNTSQRAQRSHEYEDLSKIIAVSDHYACVVWESAIEGGEDIFEWVPIVDLPEEQQDNLEDIRCGLQLAVPRGIRLYDAPTPR